MREWCRIYESCCAKRDVRYESGAKSGKCKEPRVFRISIPERSPGRPEPKMSNFTLAAYLDFDVYLGGCFLENLTPGLRGMRGWRRSQI